MKDDGLIRRIKAATRDYVQDCGSEKVQVRFSVYMANKLGLPYDLLSRRFSRACGKRLEAFMIEQKIEQAKSYLNAIDYR